MSSVLHTLIQQSVVVQMNSDTSFYSQDADVNGRNLSLTYRALTHSNANRARVPRFSPTSPPPVSRAHAHPIHYSFAQAFGERGVETKAAIHIEEADMISAVSFNADSNMVATGDKGGRVVILKRIHGQSNSPGPLQRVDLTTVRRQQSDTDDTHAVGMKHNDLNVAEKKDVSQSKYNNGCNANASMDLEKVPQYRVWTQFQSHESEFDYLKSMEIEEKINQIRWCRQTTSAYRLISTMTRPSKYGASARRR